MAEAFFAGSPLGRRDEAARLKQVVRVAPAHVMHHLEIRELAEVDDVVAEWLLEAGERASLASRGDPRSPNSGRKPEIGLER